jgi:F0F1-type ATP synthase assembly protein I
MNDKPVKRRFFPSLSGVFLGLILGVLAIFTEHTSPFWITFNSILIVVMLGFAAANVIGLAVVKYRRSSKAHQSTP